MNLHEIENTVEAIVFASGDPISVDRVASVLAVEKAVIFDVADRLSEKYLQRKGGLRFLLLNDMMQMTTDPQYADAVRTALESRKPSQLSRTSLEVLAIVAYYQPVTRSFIEQLRGVDSSYTVSLLLERELIEPCGRLDVPGRPMQFQTTVNFLRTFGIGSLDQLPELKELSQQVVPGSDGTGADT